MHFTRLKLVGFKSFVEPSEFRIEAGLTGIVGPNGCGKSNLVEALRWVMGETSAKQMRGGSMDDVIFNGTDSRVARNFAEVAIQLDNGDRGAPAAFNDQSTLEVVRRIDRGGGSSYRINDQEVRARDVQLLFADVASGAHSSAIVAQGRINDIIGAKPSQRRSILEEAAGITGLHARRHEAELRLRAAEANMVRLQDVIGALESQLLGLKRQARQANRYRRVAETLRRLEALLLHMRWASAKAEVASAEARLAAAADEVERLTTETVRAGTAAAEAAARLPELRRAETEAAAALHRLVLAREALDAEERRVAEATQALDARLGQIDADLAHGQAQRDDGRAASGRLEAEHAALSEAGANDDALEAAAAEALASARAEVARAEEAHAVHVAEIAALEVSRTDLARRLEDASKRRARLDEAWESLEAERVALTARAIDEQARAAADRALNRAQAEVKAARDQVEAREARRQNAYRQESEVLSALQAWQVRLARLRAESEALEAVLGRRSPTLGPVLVDVIEVDAGYEAALGAAFGDDLDAPEDPQAAIHWRTLEPLTDTPALPEGAQPLSAHVRSPRALDRRLSQVGVVVLADGPRLRAALKPGQRLVSREGAMWRWDGFTLAPDAPTSAATRLRQRNRLNAMAPELQAAEVANQAKEQEHEAARGALTEAERLLGLARSAADQALERQVAARAERAQFDAKAAADAGRALALAESAKRLAGERAETEAAIEQARLAQKALPPEDTGRAEAQHLKELLSGLRVVLDDRLRQHDRIARERELRHERRSVIVADLEAWRARAEAAERRLVELASRRADLAAEREALEGRPAEIATQRSALLDQLSALEKRRRRTAEELAAGENTLAANDRTLKALEQALAAAREERVRLEGRLEQAKLTVDQVVASIAERLECAAEEALALSGVGPDEELPENAFIEERIRKLNRERDGIGPVNLRAEAEAEELEQRIGGMVAEKADLEAAIERLRQGISSLNREGRERMLAAFSSIDRHFRELFGTLFDGGQAHLALVDSEDPLEAGLEIMASPPGKKMQTLSLLSGGEKAMTALALLFAVFLTNPAPVCVLDEADAPLDETNVSRFCTLIEDLAKRAATRFIVVTHNRVTMARVDRLYGVTMAERGVSQLVSVNLSEAEQLRETA